MTYQEAVAFIHSVSWKGSRPGLSRMTELLARMGNPEKGLKFVHIAGTNGKGSTSVMTAAALTAAGYRTGLFVSPFVRHFNERICLNMRPIDDDMLAAATARVRPHAEAMADAPTEFELITAIGFDFFASAGCDVVVLETGMGGRLDSTNVIESPLLTVITGIDLDHTAFLGSTVAEIAREKAGIAKAGTPMLWGGESEVAARVIADKCREVGAPFHAVDRGDIRVREMTLAGTVIEDREGEITLPLLGAYQPQNVATVLSAIDILRTRGLVLPRKSVKRGIEGARWPGRFEILCREPLFIADGAHNPQGVAAAVRSIKYYFGNRRVLIVSGVMADKDYADMVRDIASVAAHVHTVTPDNPRSLAATEYAAVFRRAGADATPHGSVREAVAAALRAARDGTPVVSLGSLYMYAEVLSALEAEGVDIPPLESFLKL